MKKYHEFIGTYVVLHGKKKVPVVPLYRHILPQPNSSEGIRF